MSNISISEFRDAISINDENTRFHVTINHPEQGWIFHDLDPTDTETPINNTELRSLIGSDFVEDALAAYRRNSM